MNPSAGAADASSTGRRLLANFGPGAMLPSAAGRPGFREQLQVGAAFRFRDMTPALQFALCSLLTYERVLLFA